jgi:hypothetical protein
MGHAADSATSCTSQRAALYRRLWRMCAAAGTAAVGVDEAQLAVACRLEYVFLSSTCCSAQVAVGTHRDALGREHRLWIRCPIDGTAGSSSSSRLACAMDLPIPVVWSAAVRDAASDEECVTSALREAAALVAQCESLWRELDAMDCECVVLEPVSARSSHAWRRLALGEWALASWPVASRLKIRSRAAGGATVTVHVHVPRPRAAPELRLAGPDADMRPFRDAYSERLQSWCVRVRRLWLPSCDRRRAGTKHSVSWTICGRYSAPRFFKSSMPRLLLQNLQLQLRHPAHRRLSAEFATHTCCQARSPIGRASALRVPKCSTAAVWLRCGACAPSVLF